MKRKINFTFKKVNLANNCMFVAVNISGIEIDFALIDENAKIVSKFSISTQNKRTDDQSLF